MTGSDTENEEKAKSEQSNGVRECRQRRKVQEKGKKQLSGRKKDLQREEIDIQFSSNFCVRACAKAIRKEATNDIYDSGFWVVFFVLKRHKTAQSAGVLWQSGARIKTGLRQLRTRYSVDYFLLKVVFYSYTVSALLYWKLKINKAAFAAAFGGEKN